MLKFPRKEEGKKEKKRNEGVKKGKKGREEGERKRERNVKGQHGLVYWERRRKFVKRNEGVWPVTRKKNIFWALGYCSLEIQAMIFFNISFNSKNVQIFLQKTFLLLKKEDWIERPYLANLRSKAKAKPPFSV